MVTPYLEIFLLKAMNFIANHFQHVKVLLTMENLLPYLSIIVILKKETRLLKGFAA
jgi:hypothetical protein